MSGLAGIRDNPYTKDLVVSDKEYTNNSAYRSLGKELEKCLDDYISTLRKLADSSSGKLAENLTQFADVTKFALGGTISSILDSNANLMGSYVSRIDAADSTLY